MGTTKKQSADNKALRKQNSHALKGFQKAKIRAAFDKMAGMAADGENAAKARQSAGLDVCKYAVEFAAKNADADRDTIVAGWRDYVKALTMELAVAGNRFAKLTEGSDDKPATAKLTGYGNNVASIAKGCLEFDDMLGESYRDTRVAVEAARAERRREADPDGALLADAKEACIEAWDELRKLVFETGDVGNVEALTETLRLHIADVQSALKIQAETDAEAEAAKAA